MNNTIAKICTVLELPSGSLDLSNCDTQAVADESLVTFKDLCKRKRRELTKRYHPDIVGDDGSKMQEINSVMDLLKRVKVFPVVQPVDFASMRAREAQAQSYLRQGANTSTSTMYTNVFSGMFGGFRRG